jgi:hypothetical protein
MTQLPTTTLYHVGSTNALPKTTTFHHEKKLACASFPYNASTISFPKTTLYHEQNIMNATFTSIMKAKKRISQLPTTMLHPEGWHKCTAKNNYIST